MRIYCIIPARGGSKGVPHKNIRPLLGKPLIAWAIEAAKKTPLIERIIVNTDDKKIAEIAEKYGAEVFFRPKELGEDLVRDIEVYTHHLSALEKKGELPDMVVDLKATAPLKRPVHITQGIELLLQLGKKKADSVRSVSMASKHPYKMWLLNGTHITPFLPESFTGIKESYNAPRQILPVIFQNNGSINTFWAETVLEKKSVTGDKIAGFVMEDWESINIDTEIDFMLAEIIMKKHLEFFS